MVGEFKNRNLPKDYQRSSNSWPGSYFWKGGKLVLRLRHNTDFVYDKLKEKYPDQEILESSLPAIEEGWENMLDYLQEGGVVTMSGILLSEHFRTAELPNSIQEYLDSERFIGVDKYPSFSIEYRKILKAAMGGSYGPVKLLHSAGGLDRILGYSFDIFHEGF